MEHKSLHVEYEQYAEPGELIAEERELFLLSRKVLEDAYAPYSKFLVGCAVKMQNGEISTGVNQENASFPMGFCAEMTALGRAGSAFPGVPVSTMAICCNSRLFEVNFPVSPCGACRQVITEWEVRYGQPVRIIFGGYTGPLIAVSSIRQLMPFMFTANDFNRS